MLQPTLFISVGQAGSLELLPYYRQPKLQARSKWMMVNEIALLDGTGVREPLPYIFVLGTVVLSLLEFIARTYEIRSDYWVVGLGRIRRVIRGTQKNS
jgi:hypothetical protein